MKLTRLTLALPLLAVFGLSACDDVAQHSRSSASTTAPTSVAQKSPQSTADQLPKPLPFRFSQAENFDIANPDKLSWRVFYDKPSTGKDAAWFDAVKRGDLPQVKYMVEHGQDIEAKDTGSLNQTALGWAAFIGYEDMVDYLISKGANLYATDTGDVYNVLKSAVLGKNTAIVKKVYELLNRDKPVDLNDQAVEDDGETLIMVAASNNRLDTVEYLLALGANPNLVATTTDKTKMSYNQSAFSYACARGHKQMQELLKKHGVINHRTGKSSCE